MWGRRIAVGATENAVPFLLLGHFFLVFPADIFFIAYIYFSPWISLLDIRYKLPDLFSIIIHYHDAFNPRQTEIRNLRTPLAALYERKHHSRMAAMMAIKTLQTSVAALIRLPPTGAGLVL